MTCGIYDREKVVYTPVGSCGSTRIERGARSRAVIQRQSRGVELALNLRIRDRCNGPPRGGIIEVARQRLVFGRQGLCPESGGGRRR